VTSKYSNKDPTSWIQHPPGFKTGIGIAHGTVEGIVAEELDHPLPRRAAELRGLDYLAIGHWHSYAAYPDSAGIVRMAYPGSHETTKFGERDSGNVLLVEIEGPNAAPLLNPLRSGGLRWTTLDCALAQPGDLSALLAEIQSVPDPELTLLRVRLEGIFSAENRRTLDQIQDILTTRFLHATLDSSAIPSPEDDGWISTLPDGPCRQAAVVLRDRAAQSSDPTERSTCTQALMILFELQEKAAS
jgi:DNA repair exonuclease SbcCD nuclease subunit